MSNKIIVYCTVSSEEDGRRLAQTLVQEHLAACVTLIPNARSVYCWQGALEESQETLLMMKSTLKHWDALLARILELHSYELPEILAVPVQAGNPPYLEWIDRSTAEL